MKKFWLGSALTITLLSTFLLTGCPADQKQPTQPKTKKETPAPKKEIVKKPGDYFPLTKGSTWQYRGEGNEYASFNRQVLYTEDNRAQIREDNGGSVSAAIFEITDSAVIRTFFQGESYGTENLLEQQGKESVTILKTPLKVGTKWQEPTGDREITAVNAEVYTPAGTFKNCIKVKVANQDSSVFEYFKDGVGMIKREFISGETSVTSTLEKYDIK